MNIFKRIWIKIKVILINYKWRFICVSLILITLITLFSTWKQINIEAINPTTITAISMMCFSIFFPVSKDVDEKRRKGQKLQKNLKEKIKKLNELLEEHKKIEIVWVRTLLNKGYPNDNKKNNIITILFSEEYFLEIEQVQKNYTDLFWQTITKNKQIFEKVVFFSIFGILEKINQRGNINQEVQLTKIISNIFFKNQKNIFYINEQVQKKINQIKSVKQFGHDSQVWIDNQIIFFEARIKYITKFRNIFHWMEGYVWSAKNPVFLKAFLVWKKSIFENSLYIYLTINGNNEYDNKILNKYIEEFDIWKKNYYSFSHFQKNELLVGVKDRFLNILISIIDKHIKSFTKIYKKSFEKINENGVKAIPMTKWRELILNKEHPKILEELIDFNDQCNYLWYSFTVELSNMTKWISLVLKVNWCMDTLEKIVKNVNFNENTRQKILKNMYLFQKDRIHEFEDFLNMLLFQEDNKLEIENLTNNLITKNQKDNQTIS